MIFSAVDKEGAKHTFMEDQTQLVQEGAICSKLAALMDQLLIIVRFILNIQCLNYQKQDVQKEEFVLILHKVKRTKQPLIHVNLELRAPAVVGWKFVM